MADLTQTRPYELDEYIQLESGEEGYISPDELDHVVDHSSFSKPKRIKQTSFGGSSSGLSGERGILTGLASRAITITFDTPFTSLPLPVILRAYRWQNPSTGVYYMENVMFSYPSESWYSVSGFSINIDSGEILTGVIVEYLFL